MHGSERLRSTAEWMLSVTRAPTYPRSMIRRPADAPSRGSRTSQHRDGCALRRPHGRRSCRNRTRRRRPLDGGTDHVLESPAKPTRELLDIAAIETRPGTRPRRQHLRLPRAPAADPARCDARHAQCDQVSRRPWCRHGRRDSGTGGLARTAAPGAAPSPVGCCIRSPRIFSTADTITATLSAAVHVLIFYCESLVWSRPAVSKRFGLESAEDAETTGVFAYNHGCYNLFPRRRRTRRLRALWARHQCSTS
ncbi:MAG: hypothetical protein JWR57_1480 [Mycetocola sp.]|jgi:hypothetical protein|nr:hypothetical protein [Mycetocola sp.]